jgi:perosamine synthetase
VSPMLRHQLPAYSPLPLNSVWAGVRGMFRQSAEVGAGVVRGLREEYRAQSALLVGSGTMALRLALAGVRATVSKRPIALPAYSCYDIASAAVGAEVSTLLYDVDPRTLGPEEDSLNRALEHEPAAVVAAHLYGYPVQMDRLGSLVRAAGAVLIEDAAQAADGSFDGAPLGSFGSVSVLSFGRGKGRTAGRGGALLSHDERGEAILAWAAQQVASPARGVGEAFILVSQWALGRPACYGLAAALPFLRLGETVYHSPIQPNAMSVTALHALRAAMHATGQEVECRRLTAQRILASARKSARVRQIEPVAKGKPGYLRLPMISEIPLSRAEQEQMRRFGLARGYPRCLDTLIPFRDRVANPSETLSGARSLAESLITVPTHSRVEPVDLCTMEAWLLQGSISTVTRAAVAAAAS